MDRRIGVVIPCYGTTRWLGKCIEQYLWCDKVLVMNYLFPESEPFPDDTEKIASKYPVEIYKGEGKQHDVLNLGIEKLKDMDLIFISDADEFILPKDQQEIIKRMGSAEMGLIRYIDYLSPYERFIERDHHPIVIVKPSVSFYEIRCANRPSVTFDDIYMHHLGFMVNERESDWKIKKQKKTGGRFDELQCRPIVKCEIPKQLRGLVS